MRQRADVGRQGATSVHGGVRWEATVLIGAKTLAARRPRVGMWE